ncbi:MAG: trypsin-like peptidase domain-containing protein [bacterium]|nr:trypsin-like peptidase domain-containing protein [bacterium]
MTQKNPKIFCVATVTVFATMFSLTAGCAPPPADSGDTQLSQLTANTSPRPLDSSELKRKLAIQAAKLVDNKKATQANALSKQLSRTKCNLSLSTRRTKPMSRREIYRRNLDGVLIISGLFKCKKCTKWHTSAASGFALTASGAIATNYHIFDNKTKQAFVATTRDGKTYPVKEVLAANAADDIAILQLDMGKAKLKPLPLAPNTPIGTDVTVISHPTSQFFTLSEGVVSNYRKRRSKRGMSDMMSITADFAKGSSGGPVFDDCGNVCGMVASTSSVYYTQTKGKQENLQMVFKQCVSAKNILKLIRTDK